MSRGPDERQSSIVCVCGVLSLRCGVLCCVVLCCIVLYCVVYVTRKRTVEGGPMFVPSEMRVCGRVCVCVCVCVG